MKPETIDERVARIWKRDGPAGNFAPLRIDGLLESLVTSARIPLAIPLAHARFISRRAIEVACYYVEDVSRASVAQISRDFETLEASARHAHEALSRLIKQLDPGAQCGEDLERSLVSARAGIEIGSPQKLHAIARADGVALWRALEIALPLETTAARKARRVRDGRLNPGKPEHKEFTSRLAECWVFVAGKAPGRGLVFDKNPFLRFVTAAWKDAYGEEDADSPLFIGALRSVDFTACQILKIRADGPEWQ